MGAPYSFTFQRTEVKYRIPADRYEEFRKEMDPYIGLDAYGLSTICNNSIEVDNPVVPETPGTYTVTYSMTITNSNQENLTGSVRLFVTVREA